MIRVLIIFAVLVSFVVIVLGGLAVGKIVYDKAQKKESRRQETKLLTDPKIVAEEAADAFLNNDMNAIRKTLKTAAVDWNDKDWKQFHSVREDIIADMRAKDSRLSSEMKYLEELNRQDNAVENALNEIRGESNHDSADMQWERLFSRELEADERRERD